ncbi:antA/AntB antirepressor family protein [Mucilaginibacter lappiensis]|uniref:antA/AntB antirepressor family protein n=1 Tax=Mucilaginibacter lappiensis TaxID=354630 RepID=UPI003D1F85F0
MIDVYYSPKGTPYVMGSDLHEELQIKTPLRKWFPSMIEYGFVENQDFSQMDKKVHLDQGGNTVRKDWAVTVEMAKHIAMVQKTAQGKITRDYLLQLDQKVNDGEYLNQGQILALMDICKVMGYFSVQDFFEKEHYEKIFKGTGAEWWERRASLFGYSAADLKKALLDIGEKYKNQKQALFKTDRLELIRRGVVDMFIVMGKSVAFAKNVGNIAKTMSEKLELEIYNDLDTSIDFKSEEQKLIVTDLKNYATDSALFKRFTGGKQQKASVDKNYNQLNLGLEKGQSGNTTFDDAMSKALQNKPLK